MFEPVYGLHGNVVYWVEAVTSAQDDDDAYAKLHRTHLLRRFYTWKHVKTGVTGRSGALFLDLDAYQDALAFWNMQSPEWTHTIV